MTFGRLKQIRQMAAIASETKLVKLYLELYGAEVRGVPAETIRESIIEACNEILEEEAKHDLT